MRSSSRQLLATRNEGPYSAAQPRYIYILTLPLNSTCITARVRRNHVRPPPNDLTGRAQNSRLYLLISQTRIRLSANVNQELPRIFSVLRVDSDLLVRRMGRAAIKL